MRQDLLFLLSVGAFWAGAILLYIAAKKAIQRQFAALELGTGAVLWLVTGPLLGSLGRPLPGQFSVPIVWLVSHVSFWFVIMSAGLVFILGLQMFSAIDAESKKLKLKAITFWFCLGIVSAFWFGVLRCEVKVLKGAIALSLPQMLALVALFLTSLFIVRKAPNKGSYQKRISISRRLILLITGSLVFSLPLLWTVLTSFKEAGDTTGSMLNLMPMVTEVVEFYDTEKPIFRCQYQGQTVSGFISHDLGSNVELELERPFTLRGYRISVARSELKEIPRQGIAVTAQFLGITVKGYAKRELGGGKKLVSITNPENLIGREFETSSAQPVRKVGLHWQNYAEALEWLPAESRGGLVYLQNSLILFALSVVGTLLSCSFVAYGFARIKFPFRSLLFSIMLGTMMLPGAVTMLQKFLVWKSLGVTDSLVPLWLPAFTGSAFYIFLLREFFKTIPIELEDASKIDGCNPLMSYWKIMLPQIKPALIVVGIWTGLGAWNDFMGPLIYVSSAEKMPISYGLQLFSADKSGDFGLLMAFATMTCIPVVLLFLACQKFFVEGIQFSGIGGK